jgi:CubicO group peptidase (beta-lactamase class C family)
MTDLTTHARDADLRNEPGSEPGKEERPVKTRTAPGGSLAQDVASAATWFDETEIQGTCPDRFGAVRDAFAANLTGGADVGASVAVYLDGEPVVDLWGGYFDMSYTRPWERDTIVHTFSTTKTMTAMCGLILADRGEIDLDAPVARYWPDFAAEGKGGIAVRQLLDYTSGMAGWTEAVTLRDLCDREKSTALLARQAPWWEPGTAAGYHGFTVGHLVGEVVRRVTGLTLGTFFAQEIAGPLGAEFHIGTGPEYDRCVSNMIPGVAPAYGIGHQFYDRALFNPALSPYDAATLPWRRAEVGAINGHGNARGIATVQSILASGGVGGRRLLSEAGRERVLQVGSEKPDVVISAPLRWGLGYSTQSHLVAAAAGSRVAWWGGNGGSLAYVDLDRRLAFGYAQNRWIRGAHELDRSRRLLDALYASLVS